MRAVVLLLAFASALAGCTDFQFREGLQCSPHDNCAPGFFCDTTVNVCLQDLPDCGNNVLDPGEVCDDDNRVSGDGCRADCLKFELCGDGTVDAQEKCDDGNTVSGDGCRSDCQKVEECGDGIVDPSEQCDNGPANGDTAPCLSTCLAAPATQVTLTSGNGQATTAGSMLASPLVVTVEDAHDNPVPGIAVDFVVIAGGGSTSMTSVVTNAAGQAAVTWTLGTISGTNALEVRAPGLIGSPIAFTAQGLVGAATQITLVSGDDQTGVAGSPLVSPLVVRVADANDNAVSGSTVNFAVIGGAGSLSVPSAVTNAQGLAQTTLTLGTSMGINTVQAQATGLAGAPVILTAMGVAGPATSLMRTSGHNQTSRPALALGQPLVVTATDVNANPVAGVAVTFVVTAGGGALSTTSAITDAQGVVQTTWTVGGSGVNSVEARSPGLAGSPIKFAAGVVGFSANTEFAATTLGEPSSIAIGDLNGDGKPDVVAVDGGNTDAVALFVNTTATGATTPSFAAEVDVFSGHPMVMDVAIGDLNGDGKPDLAIAALGDHKVAVMLNTTPAGSATPSFAASVGFPTGMAPEGVAIGDLNGDGKLDLLVGNNLSDSVSVLLNTTAAGATTPTFTTHVDFAGGPGPIGVTVGDINGDGKLDLIAACAGGAVAILFNTTVPGAMTPSFTAHTDLGVNLQSYIVAVGDLDGDGKVDLAVSTLAGAAQVFLNRTAAGASTPTFQARVDFAVGAQNASKRQSLAIGDLDGDGKPDLAMVNPNANTVSVLLNQTPIGGVALFGAKLDFATAALPQAVGIRDLNGDGHLDLVVANGGSRSVSALLRK